jgi:hypothetical protein
VSQHLAQLFTQIARVGRLGHWLEIEFGAARLDLGTLYVLVTRTHAQWNWTIYEETGPHQFSAINGGVAKNRTDAKLLGITAVVKAVKTQPLPFAGLIERRKRALRPPVAESATIELTPTGLAQMLVRDQVCGLVDLAMIRLDAEMDGRMIP